MCVWWVGQIQRQAGQEEEKPRVTARLRPVLRELSCVCNIFACNFRLTEKAIQQTLSNGHLLLTPKPNKSCGKRIMVSKTDDIPASVPSCNPVDLAREGETANGKDTSKTALKDPCACGKRALKKFKLHCSMQKSLCSY